MDTKDSKQRIAGILDAFLEVNSQFNYVHG